jgi:hypothetical protein
VLRRWIRPLLLVGIILGVWGMAVLVARPHGDDPAAHPYVGGRGASRLQASGLAVYVGEGGMSRPLQPGAPVHARETLHFMVRAEKPRYLVVRYRDGAGQERQVFPAAGAQAGLVQPGHALPVAVSVDPDGRRAFIVALWADHPFPVDGPPDADVEPLLIELPKEP